MQQGTSPLGALAWFQTGADAGIERAEMHVRLEKAGFTEYLPGNRHPNDALRLALKGLERDLSSIPTEDGHVGGIVVASVTGKDGTLVWNLHLRVRNEADVQVDYRLVAKITLGKGQTTPTVQVLDESDPMLAMGIESLPSLQQYHMDRLDAEQIRRMATEMLESLKGVRVRNGVSFVVPSALERLSKMEHVFDDLPSGYVSFSCYTLAASAENKTTVQRDLLGSMREAADALKGHIQDVVDGKKQSPKAELSRLDGELASLRAQIDLLVREGVLATENIQATGSLGGLLDALRARVQGAKNKLA